MVTSVRFSIDVIRDEAHQLVRKGTVSRQQPIYVLCRCFPACEWNCVEWELAQNDFLLRDRIIDLLGREDWQED